MVVQIFIAQGQTIDSLGYQLLYRMFDQIGIPIIGEASGKLVEDPDALLNLPQQQTTAVATDRSAVELRALESLDVLGDEIPRQAGYTLCS